MKRRIKSFDTCRVRFEIATLSPENLRRTGFEKRVVDDITVQVQKGETVSPYIQISYKASLIPAIDSTFDAARMLFFPSAIVREACSQIDATI
jgi:hypothetical protein